MAGTEAPRVEAVRLSRFEQLPWRRIILVILGIVVIGVVAVGATRTLTLAKAEGGYSAGAWRDFVVQGAAQGAIFAMIALGYSLVYGILRMINFAHGEVFMAGAFGSFFFADAYEKSGFLDRDPILALAIITAVAVGISVGTAVLLERLPTGPSGTRPGSYPSSRRSAPRSSCRTRSAGSSVPSRTATRSPWCWRGTSRSWVCPSRGSSCWCWSWR